MLLPYGDARRMRLLDRYLLRELLLPFGYCLGGFLIFYISFDILTEMDDFHKWSLTVLDIVEYYVMKLPEFVVLVLPIAFLLGLLYSITNHARHHEITAIRAAGVGIWRLTTPYLALGTFFSVLLFICNEYLTPEGAERAEQITMRYAPYKPSLKARKWERKFGFINARASRTWFIEAYNTETFHMVNPHVEWTLDTGTRCEITAERAWYVDGGWVFTNVQELVFPPMRGSLPVVSETNLLIRTDFSETPEQIRSEIKISRLNTLNFKSVKKAQLSIREILNYKRLHENDPKMKLLDTKLYERLSAPARCLVVVLIAIPFGAAPGRRNVFAGVASSIIICFTYFVLLQLGVALGIRGTLPPWLAAWSPNLFFGLGGLWLTNRIR